MSKGRDLMQFLRDQSEKNRKFLNSNSPRNAQHLPETAPRKCLKCGETFISSSKGRRICAGCLLDNEKLNVLARGDRVLRLGNTYKEEGDEIFN